MKDKEEEVIPRSKVIKCPDCNKVLIKRIGTIGTRRGVVKYICGNPRCKVIFCILNNNELIIIREGFHNLKMAPRKQEGNLTRRQLYLRNYHLERYHRNKAQKQAREREKYRKVP